MHTDDPKLTVRVAVILGVGLCAGGLILAIGIWLAADRLGARVERAVLTHGTMTRDAGVKVAMSLEGARAALNDHAVAVRDAGQTISRPELRVVEPLPIREPVRIEGVQKDGSLNINATVGKEE